MLVANPFRRVKQIISIQERVYIEIFDCLLQTGATGSKIKQGSFNGMGRNVLARPIF